MTEKRFTNIEHDYENAWIKCKDNGDFMIYAIYKELDESLPSLEDLLNGLSEENEQLKQQNSDWETSFDICKHYKETYANEIIHIKTTIKTMMENERTELGRSVLKQLWEAIQ